MMRTIARCALAAAIILGAAQQTTAAGAADAAPAEHRSEFLFVPDPQLASPEAKPARASVIVRAHDFAFVLDLGRGNSFVYVAKSDAARCATTERIRLTAGGDAATIIAETPLHDCAHAMEGPARVMLRRGTRTIDIDPEKWSSFGIEAIDETDLGAAVEVLIRGPLAELAPAHPFAHLAVSRIAPLLAGEATPARHAYAAKRLR